MKRHSPVIFLFILFLFISAGCGPLFVEAGTSVPIEATEAAIPQPDFEGGSPFPQTGETYVHKSGAFQLPALDWDTQETDDGVIFTSSNAKEQVIVNVTSTGRELDHTALEYFAFAVEDNLYVHQTDYQLLDIQSHPEAHTVSMQKSYTDSGSFFYNYSMFIQRKTAVYSIELMVQSEVWQPYAEAFPALIDSIKFEPEKVGDLRLYQPIMGYTAPQGTYSLEIPVSWFFHADSPDTNIISETFTSPDQLAYVQVISVDTGAEWNLVSLKRDAIVLLDKYSVKSAGDIRIGYEETLAGGKRQRMDWESARSGYSGMVFYEVHGTQLFLLNLVSIDNELYKPVLKHIAETYTSGVPTPTP